MGRIPGRLPALKGESGNIDWFAPLGNLAFGISLAIAFVGWWTAFIGQIVAESKAPDGSDRSPVGVAWFAMSVLLLFRAAVHNTDRNRTCCQFSAAGCDCSSLLYPCDTRVPCPQNCPRPLDRCSAGLCCLWRRQGHLWGLGGQHGECCRGFGRRVFASGLCQCLHSYRRSRSHLLTCKWPCTDLLARHVQLGSIHCLRSMGLEPFQGSTVGVRPFCEIRSGASPRELRAKHARSFQRPGLSFVKCSVHWRRRQLQV